MAHTVGTNAFFAALIARSRQPQSPGPLTVCWSEARCRRHSPAAVVTVFTPAPLPLDRMTYDPRDTWRKHFADLDTAVAASGLGDVQFVAPFIPTVAGTDRSADELR